MDDIASYQYLVAGLIDGRHGLLDILADGSAQGALRIGALDLLDQSRDDLGRVTEAP